MNENEYGDLDLDLENDSISEEPQDEKVSTSPAKEQDLQPTMQDKISLPREEWEQVQGTLSQIQRERFFDQTILNLKQEFPNFDKDKVVSKLKEIHAKDENQAQQYNTPIGFRALWLMIEKEAAQNDPVNGGVSKGGGSSFQTYLDDAMQNKQGALRKAINLAL